MIFVETFGDGVTITDSLNQFIVDKITRCLKPFNKDIKAYVKIEKISKDEFDVSIETSGNHCFNQYVNTKETDVYRAIDTLNDKLFNKITKDKMIATKKRKKHKIT